MYMLQLFNKDELAQAIGLDIGTSSVKVVQLRREKNKIILDTYGEVALGPYAGLKIGQGANVGDEKLFEAVQDLFKEAKVTARNTVVAINPSGAFVSLVKVPRVDEEQLRTMMPLEARKYIPMPLTEVQMDWWHVPDTVKFGNDEKSTNVVLAAVNNSTLITYDTLVKKLELTNVEYEIHGYSLLRSSPPHTHNMVLHRDRAVRLPIAHRRDAHGVKVGLRNKPFEIGNDRERQDQSSDTDTNGLTVWLRHRGPSEHGRPSASPVRLQGSGLQ
jgi:Tfp pilus assembly PilM family ATPase